MGNQNNIGEQIKDAVQDAINSKDYSKLNETVSKSIGIAAENISKSILQATQNAQKASDKVSQSMDQVAKNIQQGQQRSPKQNNMYEYHQAGAQGGRRQTFNDQWINQPYQQQQQDQLRRKQELMKVQDRYVPVSSPKATGYFMAIGGGILSFAFAVGVIAKGIVSLVMGGGAVGLIVLLAFLLASVGLLAAGINKISFLKSFQNYIRIIGTRTYCDVKELAEQTGKTNEFVKKNLQKMLKEGLFRNGHMDGKQTCIMVTEDAYKQYRNSQAQLEERQKQEQMIQSVQQKKDTQAQMTKEVQDVLDEGNAYIAKIHACNEAIPGEAISQKIARMENIVQKIFQRVKENPKVIPDLKKLMEYYLPTTVKLLDAYADLDKQPIQGENIVSSKKEIEDTLDTLNVAFEKILDSIFRDVAWDVSTDISVLHTVLAQEGLTADDFNLNKETAKS